METEVQPKKRIALQVKCTELLTYRNQTCQVCSAGAEGEWYVISGKHLQWKLRYGRKTHTSPREVPLITNRSQPNLQCT